MSNYTLNIRPKRQATFPAELLAKVGMTIGDQFLAEVSDKKIVLKPKKQIALDALKEIQKAFRESGISEKEMLESLKKEREEYVRKNYPDLY